MNYKTNLQILKEDSEPIINFALNNYLNKNFFEDNGPGRYFCILNQVYTPVTDLAVKFKIKQFGQLGIFEFFEEPNFGIFLGVNTEGGNVHSHIDPTSKNYYHFRLNFLLSKPSFGGEPIIENKKIDIEEGESWINLASEWRHSSTVVIGKKPRIVLSLGALVKEEYFKNTILNKIYDQNIQ